MTKLTIIVGMGGSFSYIHENPTFPDPILRCVVEPKESVKEIPISYKHRVAACAMIDGNPMTLQKIACYNWETFMGFLYADGSIEADFKRVRNGQVEWATKVRVKE